MYIFHQLFLLQIFFPQQIANNFLNIPFLFKMELCAYYSQTSNAILRFIPQFRISDKSVNKNYSYYMLQSMLAVYRVFIQSMYSEYVYRVYQPQDLEKNLLRHFVLVPNTCVEGGGGVSKFLPPHFQMLLTKKIK